MAASGLLAAIPPACRQGVDDPASVQVDADLAVVDTPVWPTPAATSFVPALAIHTAAPFSARLELSVRVDGTWSPWVGGASLGPASFEPMPSAGALEVDVDVFRSTAPTEAARLRLRLHTAEPDVVMAAPWMLSLSASDGVPGSFDAPPARVGRIALEVPARSQMDGGVAIASRICSPTCVAMLLDFWRRPATPLEALATEMFHPGLELYGVWPAAILAAGRRGLGGYLLRFPDWTAAQWCLTRGLPIIASVRYAAGELTGAAASATPGHLVVLTGWDGDDVLVNDPAAPSTSVARRYPRAELTRIWLERTGIGYVIFPVEREAAAVTGG
jgi:hypothetical protein